MTKKRKVTGCLLVRVGLLAVSLVAASVLSGCGEHERLVSTVDSPGKEWTASIVAASRGVGDSGRRLVRLQAKGALFKKKTLYWVEKDFLGRLQWLDARRLALLVDFQVREPEVWLDEALGVSFEVVFLIPRPIRVMIPVGFSGAAAVVFGVAQAAPLKNGLALQCLLSEEGVLRTSEELPGDFENPQYWLRFGEDDERPLYRKGIAAPGELQILAEQMHYSDEKAILVIFVGREESAEECQSKMRVLLEKMKE